MLTENTRIETLDEQTILFVGEPITIELPSNLQGKLLVIRKVGNAVGQPVTLRTWA